jgi:hypothetical protein
VTLTANADPNPGETGMPLGVILRMRSPADAASATLFARADTGQPSRDGTLELLNWSVSGRHGDEGRPHAKVMVSFAAPVSFIGRISSSVTFELGPGQDREVAAFKHAARSMTFRHANDEFIIREISRVCTR